MLSEKRCALCGELKPVTAFHRKLAAKSGWHPRCKQCRSEHHEPQDQIKQQATRRRWMERHPDRMQAARLRWLVANPAAARAHYTLTNAVRDGRIIRPATCQECGTPCVPDGHHADYEKPLDIEWLCLSCHRKRDRRQDWDDLQRAV